MKISLTSISVGDQQNALEFYTTILGFIKKNDIPLGGEARWLTLVSPEDKDGTELLLEPNAEYPAMRELKKSLIKSLQKNLNTIKRSKLNRIAWSM